MANTHNFTQAQRDALTAFRRNYNERHNMLLDGRMQVKLYPRYTVVGLFGPPAYVAFVERNGSVSYGTKAIHG